MDGGCASCEWSVVGERLYNAAMIIKTFLLSGAPFEQQVFLGDVYWILAIMKFMMKALSDLKK